MIMQLQPRLTANWTEQVDGGRFFIPSCEIENRLDTNEMKTELSYVHSILLNVFSMEHMIFPILPFRLPEDYDSPHDKP